MGLICLALSLYVWVIIVRIILEWIQVPRDHPVGRMRDVLAAVTDPVLIPVRRLIPPISLGSAGLDLSPLVVIIAIQVLRGALCR
jgi:YggT family protein